MTEYKKKTIRAEIISMMRDAGTDNPVFHDHIDAYIRFMEFQEELEAMADELREDPDKTKSYLATLVAIRRMQRAMLDTLSWLGLSPSQVTTIRRKADVDL